MADVTVPPEGATASHVNQWWTTLTPDEQARAIEQNPRAVGGSDGVPARARDAANRALLRADLAAPHPHAAALSARQALDESEGRAGKDDTTVDPITGESIPVFLLLYRPDAFGGDGAVALAIGDPDTANNLAVSVPGSVMDATKIPGYARQARHLYESARMSDPATTTACIAWLGYDAPALGDVRATVTERAAILGGTLLARFVEGLEVARTDPPRTVTVIGHSYGSTTAAHAASGPGLDADNLVLVGSPGAGDGVDHASDLNVAQVWAGTASRDLVATLADNGWVGAGVLGGAGLGNDVAEDDFGALRFQAENAERADEVRTLADHSRYYDRGTESIFNLGQIAVGDYSEVTRAEHITDPWWGPPRDPEAMRTPTPTVTDMASHRRTRRE